MKTLKILCTPPLGKPGMILFNNDSFLDYDFVTEECDPPNRLSTSIEIYDPEVIAQTISADIKALTLVEFMLEKFPDAQFETITDETLEYIFYLTDTQYKQLLS